MLIPAIGFAQKDTSHSIAYNFLYTLVLCLVQITI